MLIISKMLKVGPDNWPDSLSVDPKFNYSQVSKQHINVWTFCQCFRRPITQKGRIKCSDRRSPWIVLFISVLPSAKGHGPSAGFERTSRGSCLGLMLIIIGTLTLFKVSFSKKIGRREAQSDVVSPLSNSQASEMSFAATLKKFSKDTKCLTPNCL